MQDMPGACDRPFSLSPDDAVFLDFDGTLAGLQDDADTVFLAHGMDHVLRACANRLDGALAVMSGRDLYDLSRRVPDSLWRFGNHGLRASAPGGLATESPMSAPPGLIDALSEISSLHVGVRLEPKGPVLALHYRAAPDLAAQLESALTDAIEPFADYILQHGKMVFEAKPAAANKGACLLRAMQSKPFLGRRPVMIGDDTTDEDAFASAQSAGGLGVKVGEGTTVALHHLDSVQDVHTLLKEFAST